MMRILSYNVKMLPGLTGNGGADLARAQAISQAVLRGGVDICCLQEVFDEDARQVFSRTLEPQLSHQVTKSDAGDLFNQDSGLFFASRFPIAEHWFEEFDSKGPIFGTDRWADKGVFGAVLQLEGSRTLQVYNTHLQSDADSVGQYAAVRREQLDQIHRFVGRTLGTTSSSRRCAMIAGDFNISADTQEHTRMLAALGGARDLLREFVATPDAYTWDGLRNTRIPPDDDDQLRLDYVLAATPAGFPGAERLLQVQLDAARILSWKDDAGDLSDHYGVQVDIDFRL